MKNANKRKIINDPVYGFINIPNDRLFDLMEHPYVQRLRRIKQLGLSNLVYPGAEHTRFSHSIGAMFLMGQALDVLKQKGEDVNNQEYSSALEAILLHDIGHSPISHCLEEFFIESSHEERSLRMMEMMGVDRMTRDIFSNNYHKKFLHQLVSSQLDTDRLDYLTRDSFFTGVSEGVIGTERIIKMISVKDDEIAVEQKGIYSIEKFIISRRLMYWQVYLHKTVIAADSLLFSILKRARDLVNMGKDLYSSLPPAISYFIKEGAKSIDNEEAMEMFAMIDDNDIWTCVKLWAYNDDEILSLLSQSLLKRRLGKVLIKEKPFTDKDIEECLDTLAKNRPKLSRSEIREYFIRTDEVKNKAYSFQDEKINILFKNGEVKEIYEASDQLDKSFLSKEIKKYYLYRFH